MARFPRTPSCALPPACSWAQGLSVFSCRMCVGTRCGQGEGVGRERGERTVKWTKKYTDSRRDKKRKAKPEGGPQPPGVTAGGCSQKGALLPRFWVKTIRQVICVKVSLFCTRSPCTVAYTRVHMYTCLEMRTCTHHTLEYVPMACIHVLQ